MTPSGSLIAYSTPANIRQLRDQMALISMTWHEQVARKRSAAKYHSHSHSNHRARPSHSAGQPPSKRTTGSSSSTFTSASSPALETLTLEFEGRRNVIVRYLQPKVLLVLEGGALAAGGGGGGGDGRSTTTTGTGSTSGTGSGALRITAEAHSEARYPAERDLATSSAFATNGEARHSADAKVENEAGPEGDAASGSSTAVSNSSVGRMDVLDVQRRRLEAMAASIKEEFARSGFEMPDELGDRFF